MNIREAKEEILHTLQAYHRRDESGNYVFPLVRQRPILLIGPPGIGKTAIMEQIAGECGVGLVSYTITHHTRQSAIGLPKIVTKRYGDTEVSVTEYTLSEIIDSVYACLERTGKREGILFIDEVNCVSETLAPTMLQFLQNKTFGSHRVPEGWMIVAAGNPPQYNKSVREFDIVTLDRVRRIEIEASLDAWMEYAWEQGVHGAILSYLTVKKDHFYVVEHTADEKEFVTARGWEDLSELLKSYEELGIKIEEKQIVQYLQKETVARSFAAYYQLFRTYETDYGTEEILAGGIAPESERYTEKVRMAQRASFEERLTVIGLLLDSLGHSFADYERMDAKTVRLHELLRQLKGYLEKDRNMEALTAFIEEQRSRAEVQRNMELVSSVEAMREESVLRILEEYDTILRKEHRSEKEEGFARITELFSDTVQRRAKLVEALHGRLSRAFRFAEDCFGREHEMILLVTGLSRNARAMGFICMHGCREYLRYGEELTGGDTEALQRECRELLNTQNGE